MHTMNEVLSALRAGFAETLYPGDPFLQGSWDGCEPEEEVGPFRGKDRWQELESGWLDRHGTALSFFSEGAFRFFLPAYLVADVQDGLERADPLFHLTWPFHRVPVEVPARGKVWVKHTGGPTLLNPRRYGAISQRDYGCYRLSVFCREEVEAIVAYLEYKRDSDEDGFCTPQVEAALEGFWKARLTRAPAAADLNRHVADEMEFVSAMSGGIDPLTSE